LSVLGLTASGGSITSEPFPVPTCNLLDLKTTKLILNVTRDPVNGTTCGEEKAIEFVLCRDAVITFTLDGADVMGGIDGSGVPRPLRSIPLAAGLHGVTLPADVLGVVVEKLARFEITAMDQGDPQIREVADGEIQNPIAIGLCCPSAIPS